MNRSLRRFVALFAAAVLAFAQLAVSAYACPAGRSGQDSPVAASETRALSDCEEGECAQPALCHSHCQQLAQSLDRAEVPGIAPITVTGFTPALVDKSPISRPARRDLRAHLLARSTEPPLTIRNCCFRI